MGKTQAIDPDRYEVPGLVRGLHVLGAFTPQRSEMTLSEIAAAIGQTRSATFRTVYTLTKTGYLLQDSGTKTYALGPAVLKLGHGYMASRALYDIALPELEKLRDVTDWSTHLGVRDGDRVLYMLRVPSKLGLGSIVHVGSRLPAAMTTIGRVLLADLDEETFVAIFRSSQVGRSQSVRQPLPDLLRQWRADRRQDTIAQIGAFEAGVASVAAPVRDISGRAIAAISATRFAEDQVSIPNSIRNAVLDAARAISRLLGQV